MTAKSSFGVGLTDGRGQDRACGGCLQPLRSCPASCPYHERRRCQWVEIRAEPLQTFATPAQGLLRPVATAIEQGVPSRRGVERSGCFGRPARDLLRDSTPEGLEGSGSGA